MILKEKKESASVIFKREESEKNQEKFLGLK